MNRGDESDEEVYLSEPDSDDTSSIGDYEVSNDSQLDAARQADEPAVQDEIDYALHDAEVARANVLPSSLPAKPATPAAAVPGAPASNTAEPPVKSSLSADAAPWVPSGYTASVGSGSVSGPPLRAADNAESSKTDSPTANLTTTLPEASDIGTSKDPESETPKPSEATPANGRKNADPLAEESPAKEDESSRYDSAADTSSSAPEPQADEQKAVSTIEKASTPEEAVQAVSSQLPTPEAFTESASAADESSVAGLNGKVEKKDETAVGGLNGEGKQDLNGEGENIEDSAKETSKPEEDKERSSELQPAAAAAPSHPSASESVRETDSSSSAGKENVEPVTASPASVSGRSSAAPSLPPRPAAKGLGSGLGTSLPPRGMPSLPARPGRRSSASSSQEEPTQRAAPPSEAKQTPAEASKEPEAPQKPDSQSTQPQPAQVASQAPTPARTEAPSTGESNAVAVNRPQRPTPQPAPSTSAPLVQSPPESDQVKRVRSKLRDLRVQLFRLAQRLNYEDHNLVKTIKYRLDHAERVRLSGAATGDDLLKVAKGLERQNSEEVIYEVTVMIIGVTGAGKSAMINSLLGYEAVSADAFEGTTSVKEVSDTLYGIKLKMIDTPGLSVAADAASHNNKVLKSIDKARKKYKPDLVIYCDRMDMLRRDLADLPVLRRVTETLGSEVWFNTLLVFTHATSTFNNPRGEPFPFEQASQTRAQLFQRAVQVVVGDGRINVPTTFAENSPACPKNEQGESVLPNGLAWRRFILMYLASIKVLREADTELQTTAPKQENNAMSQLSMLLQAQRGVKLPPLPFLITNMIKHAGPKQYPQGEQDIKREDEIKAIRRFGLRRKEFRKRTTFLKNKQAERRLVALGKESEEPELDPYEPPNQGPALGPTFDSDENSLYYRAYEPRAGDGGWLTRPRLEQNSVDHTDGVESLTTERSLVKRGKGQDLDGIPFSMHAIIQKDKFNQLFQGGAEASYYQNYKIIHTGRAQMMTLSGGDMLYISQLETMLRHVPRNKLSLGGMVSRLAEADSILPLKGKVAIGMKLENELDLPDSRTYNLKNNIKAGIGRGVIKLGQGRKEQATGMNAEWQLTGGAKENVQVMGSFSQMAYRGNKGRQYALSANIPVTEETTLSPKLQLQSGQGSLTLRCASHDYSNLGLVVFLPLAKALWDKVKNNKGEDTQQPLVLR